MQTRRPSTSTALLHSGANERKHVMLEKLGGKEVLQEATDKFYDRQIHDERLLKFFKGTDLTILKWHQFNLMGIAFTAVPENFDVLHLILKRHAKLFDDGLDETYFDVVMEHFEGTLIDMKVEPSLIKDALQVILPLREVFIQGRLDSEQRAKTKERWIVADKLALGTIVVVLTLFTIRSINQKTK